MIIIYSTAALAVGFALDMLLGDPRRFPHIVRGMGAVISLGEKLFRRVFSKTPRGELAGGAVLTVLTLVICAGIPCAALTAAYRLSPALGFALETFLCWQLIAVKSLKTESLKVHDALAAGDLGRARRAPSMIVGRGTRKLGDREIIRAAVETVSENTSDGVIAPMLYILVGGAALGCMYKAVNTMDSMLGYKNERYLYFGRAAARLDDVANYIPSRLAAVLMLASCAPLGFDARRAYCVWKRDRRKHQSPNSAQTEAVCAGALGLRLAGPAEYSGVMCEKPYIGDDTRPADLGDIPAANRLLYAAAGMMLALAVVIRGVIYAAL